MSGNLGQIYPRTPFGHYNHQNHSHKSTDGDGLWPQLQYMASLNKLTNKQTPLPAYIVTQT